MKDCNLCGKCCHKYSYGGLSVTSDEIELWRIFKPEIHSYVMNGEIWFDPDTKKQLVICPWLRHQPDKNMYVCDIYYDRPDDCKFYPVTIEQMINDDCEMLEKNDLINTGQAQKKLDILMADSRPSLDY